MPEQDIREQFATLRKLEGQLRSPSGLDHHSEREMRELASKLQEQIAIDLHRAANAAEELVRIMTGRARS